MIGKVKEYNPARRFGYIKGDDGEEYFFHQSEIKTPSGSISKGYTVQFSPSREGFPKRRALNVNFF